jgi:hypothetical protein
VNRRMKRNRYAGREEAPISCPTTARSLPATDKLPPS